MQYQGRSKRTKTGARTRPHSKKKKHELGRSPTETTVGEPRIRTVDSRGDSQKVRALATDVANVSVGGETPSSSTTNSGLSPPLSHPESRQFDAFDAFAPLSAQTPGL